MSKIAKTPNPPYYAVIFSSTRTEGDNGYEAMSDRMLELAAKQPGYLGVESAREELGVTVSYWSDLESISHWKANVEHQQARKLGHEKWYSKFKVRISNLKSEFQRLNVTTVFNPLVLAGEVATA